VFLQQNSFLFWFQIGSFLARVGIVSLCFWSNKLVLQRKINFKKKYWVQASSVLSISASRPLRLVLSGVGLAMGLSHWVWVRFSRSVNNPPPLPSFSGSFHLSWGQRVGTFVRICLLMNKWCTKPVNSLSWIELLL